MSKKIVIVTVYNSENCGSFFQAYAMQTILERCGFEVAFLQRDTSGTSHAFVPHLISAIKRIVCLKHKEIKFVWKPWGLFEKAIRIFNVCDKQSRFYQEAETFLLGSDTIWNFDSAYFKEKAKVYLGNEFKQKKVITYAVSAANTSAEQFHRIVSQHGGLDHISEFLVRDEHTGQLVENEASRSAKIVTDPTLLLHKTDYGKLIPNEEIADPYLLLYYFGEMDDALKKSVQEYAQKNNLKVISLLKYRAWCDDSIPADPCRILLYFDKASAVITNTFHGCAFSMIFERPFAVHEEGKNKVSDLLFKYGESNRLFADPREITALLDRPCEVMDNGKYDLIRNQSLELLFGAIGKCEKSR